MLALSRDVIVLDIGGTHIAVGHIQNNIIYPKIEKHSSQKLCVSAADNELFTIISTYKTKHKLELCAVVVGLPAMLDRKHDVISHCNNIPQLEGKGLKQYLSNKLGCTVLFEQDIMLQLLGEWRAGAGQKKSSVFGVYFGTGIGAAYLIDGNPENRLVQDIQAGHIPIMAEGRPCMCGNKDCIEAYANGHILRDLANYTGCPLDKLFEYRLNPQWRDALQNELDKFVLYQAYMLATVCSLFTPQLIVIGGGIPKMDGYPRELLIEKTRSHLQNPYPAKHVKFAWASLSSEAPLHGALALLDRKHNSTWTS